MSSFSENDKQNQIEVYQTQFKKYGLNERSLFLTNNKQQIRFSIIKGIGIKNNCSILDVGCGFGDLYDYLLSNGLSEINYTGIDIVPEFICEAKSRFPKSDFRIIDILNEDMVEKFDFVVLSGTLNKKIPGNHEEYVKAMLTRMYELSKVGVSADFISSYGDARYPDIYRADATMIFTISKQLSQRVTLRHDYMPYEFTVYIYKQDKINDIKVFEYFRGDLEHV